MSATADTRQDTAGVLVRPPLAWALAAVAGVVLNWFVPVPFVPPELPAVTIGIVVFGLALVLFVWAVTTMTRGGSNVPTSMPTKAIVEAGPYRFTRNPIYLGFMLSLLGLAVGLNSLWSLVTLVLFFVVIRYGVVAREEAYLERKFGAVYRGYTARVRRWL
jgi:protein-S-isoprenylcysteine O-methyltransferase Ste14